MNYPGEKKRNKNEKKKKKISRLWDSNPGPPDHEAKYIPPGHGGLLYKWLPVNGIVHDGNMRVISLTQ